MEQAGPTSNGRHSGSRRFPKRITYLVRVHSKHRKSRHLRADGQPKRVYASEADGLTAIAEIAATPGRRRGYMEVYVCPDCDGWHIGNRYEHPNPYTRRVVDRESALLVELSERTLAQMLIESHSKPAMRMKTIRTRARKS